ncbi:MAG: tetratricopeptide repeat protein [Fibromonadaceae bacterium]|jgi:tetratricopeptide (TPR) repeat protein|nr:tetratricopeptide repeat protein [Fibromonadaceae bacterium]
MQNKRPDSKSNAAPNSAESYLEYLKEEFFPKHGAKLAIVLALVAVAVFVVIQNMNKSARKDADQVEELGKALTYIYINRGDSALWVLENAIQDNKLKGLNLAKAALLAGNFHLQNGNLGSAEIFYKTSISNAGKVDIIASAAEHGLAVVAMEKQDYQEAISLLNAFINKYGKRTGDLAKRYAKTEPVDAVPTVPDAKWKLALCYLEVGDKEKAKQSAERLLRVYGDSPRAANAQKLLATL